jgi:radical SAM/Cys-rich protein
VLNTAERLMPTSFPALQRERLETLQVNLGYRCNQSCLHCHVAASPNRMEAMSADTLDQVIGALDILPVATLDITGGAPELNPGFRRLVREARARGLRIIDRCNLSILVQPEQEGLADFLAAHQVEVVASLPCYLEENVNRQRGQGAFAQSLTGLHLLNALGYGIPGSGLDLALVYNPQGASLPPPQAALEGDYRRVLGERWGIRFNRLLTLANLPVGRFGSALLSRGELDDYLALLKGVHCDANLDAVMCHSLLSVDWRGCLYDCDFNQMLDLPLAAGGIPRAHLRDLPRLVLEGSPIVTADHCYGCTAGQGSSCGGALTLEGGSP